MMNIICYSGESRDFRYSAGSGGKNKASIFGFQKPLHPGSVKPILVLHQVFPIEVVGDSPKFVAVVEAVVWRSFPFSLDIKIVRVSGRGVIGDKIHDDLDSTWERFIPDPAQFLQQEIAGRAFLIHRFTLSGSGSLMLLKKPFQSRVAG